MAILLLLQFGQLEARRLAREVDRLEKEKAELVLFAERLTASRRVAQVNILTQQRDESGRTATSLRWQEIGEDGRIGDPFEIQVFGSQVYFEALIVKFAHRYVGEGDAERGRSLALFRRIFGDQQVPETGIALDRGTLAPIVAQPVLTDRRASFWDRFWDLVNDVEESHRLGIRVAQCEAPAVRVEPGQTWEVTLDSAGGLNIKKLLNANPTVSLPAAHQP